MARARASHAHFGGPFGNARSSPATDSKRGDAMMTKLANMLVVLSAMAAIGFAPTKALAESVKDTGGYDATYTKRDIQPIPGSGRPRPNVD